MLRGARFRKLGYHLAQSCQGQVDVLELTEVLGAWELLQEDLLAARQVADVELCSLEHAMLISFVALDHEL